MIGKNNILVRSNIFFCVLIVSLFSSFIITSCKNDVNKVNEITYRDTFPCETGNNVEIIYSDSAVIVAKLNAPVINRYIGPNPHVELPKGLKLVFYDSVMNVKTSLSAKYAIKYNNTAVWEAHNDVVVTNEKGERLNTERLIWDERKRIIYSNSFVKITKPDEVLLGEGMEADESFDKWTIKKPKGSFNIKSDKE
jgi:LPS export ABC transporter protein LptC